jgi:hypothetical protein
MTIMNSIVPIIVLNALVKHETLTFPDLTEEKNLGVKVTTEDVEQAVEHLHQQKFVVQLDGAEPRTYTITTLGIEESQKFAT